MIELLGHGILLPSTISNCRRSAVSTIASAPPS
jgi:hypothetical protein